MKAVRYFVDASKGALRAVGLAVRAVLEMVHAVVSAVYRILGLAPPPMPRLPLPETSPADLDERIAREYDVAVDDNLEHASDLGRAVHAYACARDPYIRGAVDLAGLDDRQLEWLLSLPEEHLDRLAQAGARACGRAARGRRCGVVGLPVPEAATATADEAQPDSRQAARELLRERLRSGRAPRSAA